MARAAGVSQTTVSLVLGGNKQGIVLQEATRERVLEAARSLGYVPDPAARSLATARNSLMGVFSFTATFPTDVQHSYYPLLVGVEQEAAAQGYDLVLFTGSSASGPEATTPEALDRVRLADGCLFLGRHIPSRELRRLVDDGYPAVHLGRRDELEGLAWVGADYVSASADVVRRLAEAGHRRIVLVREDDDAPASTDRERGFLEGLEAAGLPGGPAAVVRTAEPAAQITAERIRAWRAEGITAFVAEETDTGGAWRALLGAVGAAGLTAPEHLSLALLGSPPADLAAGPEPTGFDVPRTELGATAVRLLVSVMSGEDLKPPEPLVSCAFRAGTTAGPPPPAGG
ncbi:LacI family DNA-binding transcriptional regulator [Streptomyces gossypii]|uniref:LacI family DNA-binding transcriptional regulator n=1 Tax=Streptomyces gossypii TaxID=2883101 RepID=UPI0035CD2C2A